MTLAIARIPDMPRPPREPRIDILPIVVWGLFLGGVVLFWLLFLALIW